MNKKLLLFFTCVTLITMACDKVITAKDLPQNAQTFIQQYFPDAKISYAKTDHDVFEKTHEVLLTDGTKIDFDRNGDWKDVDCQIKAVPDAIIPPVIIDHVKSNFPTFFIRKIEKTKNRIEIELSNDLELKFNADGVLLEVD